MSHTEKHAGFHGPACWALSLFAGLIVGWLIALMVPGTLAQSVGPAIPAGITVTETAGDGRVSIMGPTAHDAPVKGPAPSAPVIPLWLCAPFALLLASIALMPFISQRFWHAHYPDFAFALGGVVTGYYFGAFGGLATHTFLHVGEEYLGFIALVGGLYVASGGILIGVEGRGRPLLNTALLALGAVLANIVGTTGASVLLIRPFMNINQHRLHPLHVVFFIFIVSNCGGCLTPIGDPPLYLGFLKGVPFFWTATHLWPMWLVVIGTLLAIFFVVDTRLGNGPRPSSAPAPADVPFTLRIRGGFGIAMLLVIVAGVFVPPLIKRFANVDAVWAGAILQIAAAACAYWRAPREIHASNGFNFEPVKEVGLLFLGIFVAMAPALAFLQANASSLGLESGTQLYFATGVLSAVLDNAPTYLSFLQVAFGEVGLEITPANVHRYLDATYALAHTDTGSTVTVRGSSVLSAISLAAVFFGAMTYIGNGPNFMVKAIAESRGVRMPSFFGYVAYAVVFLFPVLVLNWWLFVR
ncbi:MAG: sodium:proton antiporter [Phycisphaerales bacterium]